MHKIAQNTEKNTEMLMCFDSAFNQTRKIEDARLPVQWKVSD